MDNINSHILWLANNSALIQEPKSNLEQMGYDVHFCDDHEHWLDSHSKLPDILIISHSLSFDDAMRKFLSIKSKVLNSPLLTILITNEISISDKESFFRAGGNDIIINEFGPEELQAKISPFLRLKNSMADTKQQLEEASDMAVLSMETSSDLGSIINFVKNAINSVSYQELAEHMFDVTNQYSNHSLVEIKELHTHSYFQSDSSNDPRMNDFMETHKNSNRVQHIDDMIQVNHENIIYLVSGLPDEDTAKMGRITDSLVMLCDISNRFVEALRSEETLQKSESSKNRFLTTLSHELKTPINSILGFSDILRKKKIDKPIGESGVDALSRIHNSTQTVNTIVSTLLEISEVNSDKEDHQEFDIHRLFIRLRNEFKDPIHNKSLDFTFNEPEHFSIKSNENKIYTMLCHMLNNAIKFTNKGSISLNSFIEKDQEFGDRICFEISDTGIGIDPVHHKKIFNEIGQLNTEHDREHYGIGLGLYYVNQITQQLDGEIKVSSKLNEGATFRLYIPHHTVEIDHSEDDDPNTMLF